MVIARASTILLVRNCPSSSHVTHRTHRIIYLIKFFDIFAGLVLIVTKNEEWTFWLLKILVENIIRAYHTKTMTGLIADIDVLRQMLEARVPDICQHLDYCSLPTAVITTKWFICLFAEVLPIETVLRVWDCLFFEGNKVRNTQFILN